MVPITITQPLTLTHWNMAAPQNVIGPRPLSWSGATGSDSAITAYAGIASYPGNVLLQGLTYLAIGMGSSSTWALFGTALRPILTAPRAVRAFNIIMALLLLASLYPVFMDA